MTEHNAQIGVCGLRCDFPDGKVVYFNPGYVSGSQVSVYSTTDALREVTVEERITNSPCDKIFASSIFDSVRFRERSAFEDFEIMGPNKPEKILTQLYGDYNQLPPVESRNKHNLTIVE